MKHLPRTRLAACALASFLSVLLSAPRGSSASVVAIAQWSVETPEAAALAQQPEVLRVQLRDSMGSVYVAAGLPADSLVDVGSLSMALQFVPGSTTTATATATTQAAATAAAPSGGLKATTAAAGSTPVGSSSNSNNNNNNDNSSDSGGASVVLLFSFIIGSVGLLGLVVWACMRGRRQPQQKLDQPTIPVRIDRPPLCIPPTPASQLVYYTPLPQQPRPATLPPQYLPSAPPQYALQIPPQFAPSAPPSFRVYSRS